MNVLTLSNEQLVERLLHRIAVERRCTADVLEDLAEVDARQIFVTAGYPSLTEYCIEALAFSEDQAWQRVAAARIIRKSPLALQLLRDGRVTLSTLRLLSSHLTPGNADARLAAAAGLTVKKLEVLIASWAPKPDVRTTVKFIAAAEPPHLLQQMQTAAPPSNEAPVAPCAQFPAPLPKPLSPGKRSITFTIDEDEYVELMRLRDLERHAIPDGDIKKIIVAAVRDRLAKVEARKFGKLRSRTADGGQATSATTDKRTPTQAQKREVAERDGYQCCYVSPTGKRCSSTAWVEHDHRDGWGLTHETSAARLQLLCRTHNQAKGSAPASVT